MTEARAGISARMAVMDKQIVDRDRLPIGRVDDAELEVAGDRRPPRVTVLLIGAQPLGERLGGAMGRTLAAAANRLRVHRDRLPAVDIDLVEQIEPMICLRPALAELPHVAGLEHWLAERVQRAPGAGDAPQ